MRLRRDKVDPTNGARAYHCMSRSVNSEWLFRDEDLEMFRKQLWLVSEFCGIQIVTYAFLSNHFHLLLKVPEHAEVSPAEVVRRYTLLYPFTNRYRPETLKWIEGEIARGTSLGQKWLQKQRRQMGDLSQFMKLLKQRFTRGFNGTHRRHGPLWSERFTSHLVEDGEALETIASYIDLNPVRAAIVNDPKDYRYCGYSDALAGNSRAREGIKYIEGVTSWEEAAQLYRQRLFGVGSDSRKPGNVISREALREVMRSEGTLPRPQALLFTIKLFSKGAVLGSRDFVKTQLKRYRETYGMYKNAEPITLPPITDWGNLTVLRRCRGGFTFA